MAIDRTQGPASSAPGEDPDGPDHPQGLAAPTQAIACPYLGQSGDDFTHFLQPHAGHRCYAQAPASRIGVDRQLTHCLHDFVGCSRYIPLVNGRRATLVPAALAVGHADAADPSELIGTTDLPPVDRAAHSDRTSRTNRVEDEAPRAAAPPLGWLQRRSFEEWLILGVTISLLGVIAYVALIGGPRGDAADNSVENSMAIQAVIADLDATSTPTATAVSTGAPRPTGGSEDLPLATIVVPTPPAGGLTAAIAPVERGVAAFNERDRSPDFGSRELSVGAFDGQRYLGGILFSLSKLPSASRIDYIALELAGLSDTRFSGDGDWTIDMLDPEVADSWADLTFQSLDEAPATSPGAGWTIPGAQLAPRRVNVLEFSDEARSELISRLEQGRVAFRIRGPGSVEGRDDLFIWDTGFGEGFGTRPVLRINFVPPTPTPGAAPGEATAVPLVVWIGRPTPAPTATVLPGAPPAALDGMILFLSDRFGGDGRLMVYDPVGDRIGQLTQPWAYQVARSREQQHAGDRLIVFDVPCGDGGPIIEDEDGRPIANPDPARRCQQIALHDGGDRPPREITESGWSHYDPAFSPDGEWVVYTSQITGSDEIFKVRIDGQEITRLTENEWEWDKHPSFSPDGSSVVFWSNRDGRRQLYVMNSDGTNVRPLLPGPWEDWDPVWVK